MHTTEMHMNADLKLENELLCGNSNQAAYIKMDNTSNYLTLYMQLKCTWMLFWNREWFSPYIRVIFVIKRNILVSELMEKHIEMSSMNNNKDGCNPIEDDLEWSNFPHFLV